MADKRATIIDKIFRDKHGKVVVWQNPNIPLWGWILSSVLAFVFKYNSLQTGFRHIDEAALFTWAYLEIRAGASLFRRLLGTVVMFFVVYSFFRAN